MEYEKKYLLDSTEQNIFKRLYYWLYRNTYCKIEKAFREIKHAYQRAIRGYDDFMIWECTEELPALICKILKQYNETRHGFPVLLSEDNNIDQKEQREKEEKYWNDIVEEMIFHFQEAVEETCTKTNPYENPGKPYFYKENPNDAFYKMEIDYDSEKEKEEAQNHFKTEMELEKYRLEHKKKGFEMLSKYINYIWD